MQAWQDRPDYDTQQQQQGHNPEPWVGCAGCAIRTAETARRVIPHDRFSLGKNRGSPPRIVHPTPCEVESTPAASRRQPFSAPVRLGAKRRILRRPRIGGLTPRRHGQRCCPPTFLRQRPTLAPVDTLGGHPPRIGPLPDRVTPAPRAGTLRTKETREARPRLIIPPMAAAHRWPHAGVPPPCREASLGCSPFGPRGPTMAGLGSLGNGAKRAYRTR